ncbi:MAG: hypothetical protein IMW89_19185, partial [Ktedonobacteraceae bacterium]|nr:hypothetical protein [Ktedonobacteraceae bacterium]
MILLDASHVLQRIEEVPQWIEVGGQIAAIIICLFSLIFVLLTLAFNLVMGFGLTWVREKAELIKKLRPEVEHVNNACKTSLQGEPLPEQENAVIKAVAAVPPAVHAADQRVEQVSGRVANAIIEVQARAVQVRTV